MCLGKAWPTKKEKNPLSVRREAARSLHSGNSGRLLGSLASPRAQVCPGQSGVPPHEQKPEGPSVHLWPCCHPLLSTNLCVSSGSGPVTIAVGPGPRPSAVVPSGCGAGACLSLLGPPDLHVPFPTVDSVPAKP